MKDKVKVISKECLYDRYIKLLTYDIDVPSLNPEKKFMRLKNRDLVKTHDSVHVLLYSPQIDAIVFCEEFRMGVYFNDNQQNPFILQCVAGTMEKGDTPEQTAIKEVREETGLEVNQLDLIADVYKSPGILTEKSYLFYAQLKAIPESGLHGLGDEEIKTHIISRKKVYQMMDDFKFVDSATLLALNWFRCKFP